MSVDAWLILPVGAAMALLAYVAVALSRARARREESAARAKLRIEASKAELEHWRAKLAAGEVTQQALDDHEKRIASDLLESATSAGVMPPPAPGTLRKPIALAALGIGALIAAALYFSMGSAPTTPGAVATDQVETAKPTGALSDEQLLRMIEQSIAQTEKDPKDPAAWAMLAHSYDMLGKFAESSKAYAKLVPLVPNDAQVLADYADALAVANGRVLAGEPTALVKKALAIDAKNFKALALAGSAAFERQDYDEAVKYWEAANSASVDPEFKRQVQGSIATAKAASRGETAVDLKTTTAASPPASAGTAVAVVSGRVSLADEFVGKMPADATVFIFARPASGSRMPVAILRKRVSDLPVDFTLDDSRAMVPDATLSKLSTVVIGARISKLGDVMPQPGDIQGWSAPVRVGTKGIKLEISEVLK